jgi:hypothetical protein
MRMPVYQFQIAYTHHLALLNVSFGSTFAITTKDFLISALFAAGSLIDNF